ncbi:MAG: hypothetical protein IPL10_06580 [Bacteroidetes bacterium]|nr:hypothetical protein [Bacteroidota bacterium]
MYISFASFGQESVSKCKCSVHFDDKAVKKDTVNKAFYLTYDKTIKTIGEECNEIKILKDSAGYLFVRPFETIEKYKSKKYWVKNTKQFKVNPTPHQGYLILYSDHDFKSKKTFTQKYGYPPIDQVSHSYKILNCWNEWVKVSLIFKGKEYVGWTKFFCSLACTTCT